MKVRIAYTVEVDDQYRRAIRQYYGKEGLATRDEVVHWHRLRGESMDDDLAELLGGDEDEEDQQQGREPADG